MKRCILLLSAAALVYTAAAGIEAHQAQGGKKMEHRIFELRTYYTHPGKM